MKNLFFMGIAVLAMSFTLVNETEIVEKSITKSKIVWKGYKVLGSHEGTIDLEAGSLTFDGNKLNGGTFTIDLTTIASTDLEGEYKNKLEGHLKSDDFFGVQTFPKATLQIKKAKSSGKNAYKVTGDLTIKGVTKEIKFDASIYGNKATANIKIDRTDFNVKYGSASFFEGLKDKAIYDEFDLVIDVEF